MLNIAKPTTSIANATRINTGLVWGLDLKTWAAETQTWLDTATTIDNVARVTSSISNIAKP